GGTYFIDITVPTAPVVVQYEAGGFAGAVWRDFKTYQNYCYGVADLGNSSTLQVFDLSNLPTSVTKVYDSNNFFRRAHNIFVDTLSGRLYCSGANNNNQGITVLDIKTNPANPTLLIQANLGAYSHDIYVENDTVYSFTGVDAGVQVWDFSNLPAVNLISNLPFYPEAGYCHSGWLDKTGNFLYHADETSNTGIKISDFSNLAAPSTVSTFRSALLAPIHTNSMPHNVFVRGDLLFISYYEEGVQVYDISNPVVPVKVGFWDTHPSNTDYNGTFGCWGVYPYFPSGTIIASDDLNGLFVLQLNTSFPVEYGDFTS
ncbi:MAG: choice-of-anchor B family protein, partial [Bacteroidota bacterium]